MSDVLELFGHPTGSTTQNWQEIVNNQYCHYIRATCYKVRKSQPSISIGTCTVNHGRNKEPILICPARLLERKQIFTDCLHLLTTHEPGNELHIVSEVSIPGGSVDYFLVSARDDKVKDFVGVELQTLDTTGTVWPERQRTLRELGVTPGDDAEQNARRFGMNWKMTAKTALVQMHHKIETFESVNRKLVLVIQDQFLNYIEREFNFEQMKEPASLGDSMHLHAYRIRQMNHSYRLGLSRRLSTLAAGVASLLGLQAEANVGLQQIFITLESRISPETVFVPS